MNAAFSTEGKTTTHSALSSRSCGILSGIFMISSMTMPEFSSRSVSLSLSGDAASIGAAVRAKVIPSKSSFLMNSFLLEVQHSINGAGCHSHNRVSRIFVQCIGPGHLKNLGGGNADGQIENSHSFPVPSIVWTIIDFSSRRIHRSGSMVLHRKVRAFVVGCVIFGMVVSAGTPHTAAQSPSAQQGRSRASAANNKSAARPDVERFRQRAEAALSAAGPDKGAWG